MELDQCLAHSTICDLVLTMSAGILLLNFLIEVLPPRSFLIQSPMFHVCSSQMAATFTIDNTLQGRVLLTADMLKMSHNAELLQFVQMRRYFPEGRQFQTNTFPKFTMSLSNDP